MVSKTKSPALLVFGPHGSLPSPELLEELRQHFIPHRRLCQAVRDLPSHWQDLLNFDPELQGVPGENGLNGLTHWLETGDLSQVQAYGEANIVSMPLMMVLQIATYLRFVLVNEDWLVHKGVMESVKAGGVQGFCLGFLTAAAVAYSPVIENIATYFAVGLRLAVCIGAYVDKNGVYASPQTNRTASFAVRWKVPEMSRDKIDNALQKHASAYVSCINDDSCVTITCGIKEEEPLRQELHAQGLRVKSIEIHGRFHSEGSYSSAISKLREFTLLGYTADWCKTIKGAVDAISDRDSTVILVGFTENIIPPQLIQTAGLHITSLPSFGVSASKTTATHTNGVTPPNTHDIPRGSTNGPNGMSLHVNGTTTNGTNHAHNDQYAQYPPHSVAVVGMACRFPGAESVDEFWNLLLSGVSKVEAPPEERLTLNDSRIEGRGDMKWWGNFLQHADTFDHRFFKKSAREALSWDPDKRLLLEVAYQALESSGHFSSGPDSPKDYGCYIGAVANNYYDNVSCHPPTAYSMLGTSRAFFSGRISHQFGFTGPAMSIDTACSSSLVAIHAACRAIQAGECTRAVAGGTNVITSPFDYQNLAAAGFLSPTGQCKPFDAGADGYCRGEGVAAVVLKKLDLAVAEGDHILGVITGSAVNQNFNDNHITVPCSSSQTTAYQNAIKLAGAEPETVSYVEAHGTGTQVGDPIECESIRNAFGGSHRPSTLYFGSVKGHIGHTEASAGVAGLIKVLMMMQHKTILGQASFSNLNPKIPALEPDRMEIPRYTKAWDAPSRLACVNSYGAAGSNAVVAVQQAPDTSDYEGPRPTSRYPLLLTAASAKSLSLYAEELLAYVKGVLAGQAGVVPNVTFNLADRINPTLPHTVSETVTSIEDLEKVLREVASGSKSFQREVSKDPKPVVLVFGGQDGDVIGLSEELYSSTALFRYHLDACDEALQLLGFDSIFPAIFQRKAITKLPVLHAALFSVQYASAKTWIDCGVKVDAIIGHSFGQLTALCISGSLSLHDSLRLVVGRANLISKHWSGDRGCMVAVQTNQDDIAYILKSLKDKGQGDDKLEVACYNSQSSQVLAGSESAIDALESFVASDANLRDIVRVKRLKVTHAFHSRFTEGLLPYLQDLAKSLSWQKPNIHVETCTEFETYGDPDYKLIPEHTRKPVFFAQAVARLAQRYPDCTWLEAGHGASVFQLLGACLSTGAASRSGHNSRTFPSQLTGPKAGDAICDLITDLWKAGHAVRFWPFHRNQRSAYKFLAVPPYQFERNSHWLPFSKPKEVLDNVAGDPTQVAGAVVEHKFIHLKGYTEHNGKNQANFLVDPESERYRTLLTGHITSGQALAPVSLYIELITRAAISLGSASASCSSMVARIDSLEMKAPIGLDNSKDIFLVLSPLGSAVWEFKFTSQPKSSEQIPKASGAGVLLHTIGVVSLCDRANTTLAQRFKRYEALIGRDRCRFIMDHPQAERMQGKHIYQAIQRLVHFDPMYQGIKSVSNLGDEAAGRVIASVNPSLSPDERLYDTPLIDSLMQYAGILVNYFKHPSVDEVLVCLGIERIETGGTFSPDAGEWITYAVLTEDTEDRTECDVYVFEAKSGKLVMTFLGFYFIRTSSAVLSRSLKDVNGPQILSNSVAQTISQNKPIRNAFPLPSKSVVEPASQNEAHPSALKPPQASSKRGEVIGLLQRVTDIPIEEIMDESTLEDLGIDSLLVTEVLNEVKSTFGLDIDLNTFLFFPNVTAIYTHVNEQLNIPESGNSDGVATAHEAFDDLDGLYDRFVAETGAKGFWTEVYPRQASLVLAYVVDAFAKLGCNLRQLLPGDVLPTISHLPRHKQLVRQLHRILEEGELVTVDDSTEPVTFIRTHKAVDSTPASQILAEVLDKYPQHANVHKLVQATGSEFAECLTGAKDGLQLVFGNKANKKNLDDVYEHWPLVKSGTLVLGEYLTNLFTNPLPRPGGGKFRILEIGAGTGGTTKYVVNHLLEQGVPFEYTFTDLSSSLVAAAKRNFKKIPGMEFRVMDIEKEPLPSDTGAYHVIISTNCIHATQNLTHSLTNIRRMLRPDGVVTLVEITRNMFWLDIAVGLFEGWWLFKDGREHAVASETLWDKSMRSAGFVDVAWTSGREPEANTIRVVVGFAGAS
ncbi:putative polyketide synthase [Hypoxylon fragiforme]|uniref:putative polyketide synthase n=1 Tax=Hypoxylon fragiforme TaxID=63214 RepID=UPI0020C6527C|nr:putative polyketide synthase [Hypoxylon fragiforme]KAI2605503.1 putative polyketide synthase [Hypoxylon fragiforme]